MPLALFVWRCVGGRRMETQKIRVLLVEDDFSIVRNLSSMLEQEGFAVDVAMGQAQAL